MTIGIYCLQFEGTDKVYVGQSINIEKRYKEHKTSARLGISPKKLQAAFNLYGIPTLEILIESSLEDLDTNEEEAIVIYNSVDNGFNTYYYANQVPSKGYGELSANAKYSNNQILECFLMLVDVVHYSFPEIQRRTKVSRDVISKISCGTLHSWIKDIYPEEYIILLNKIGSRKAASSDIVSRKLGAINQGIVYPNICSPDGVVHQIDNAYRFAKEHNLAGNHFQEVLNGHRKSHKGWKVCQ